MEKNSVKELKAKNGCLNIKNKKMVAKYLKRKQRKITSNINDY